jgi:hypothetical protein
MRLEGLGQLRNPMTSSGFEPATFRLVAQCLNQTETVNFRDHRCFNPHRLEKNEAFLSRLFDSVIRIPYWPNTAETADLRSVLPEIDPKAKT